MLQSCLPCWGYILRRTSHVSPSLMSNNFCFFTVFSVGSPIPHLFIPFYDPQRRRASSAFLHFSLLERITRVIRLQEIISWCRKYQGGLTCMTHLFQVVLLCIISMESSETGRNMFLITYIESAKPTLNMALLY